MIVNTMKSMAKLVIPKQLIKDIKGGFDTWMISLKSIKVD